MDICAWMSSNYRKGKLLSGIIYLHNINDVRMGGSSVKYVKMFQRLCGPNSLPNVLLTTTQWPDRDQALGEKREGELRSGDFWGGLIREGASVKRFMGTTESGLELIDKLIGNQPKPLDIQHQMVDEGKGFAQTNAGTFMSEELISLQKQFQQELQDLKSEIQKAIREKDDLLKEILEDQRARSKEKLEESAAQKKFLENLGVNRMRELEEAVVKKEEERQRRDRAVIAVASGEIGLFSHTLSMVAMNNVNGRLITDIHNAEEFRKETFKVEIEYRANIISAATFGLKVAANAFGRGMSRSNYIAYNQGYYQCNGSIHRGSEKFFIFAKC